LCLGALTKVYGETRRKIFRRGLVFGVPILALAGLTWLTSAARLWLPLDAVLRILALMLLGWAYGETTDLRTLSFSLARLRLPRSMYFALLMATALVPTIRIEAVRTAEAVKLKWGEVSTRGRIRNYLNLLVRSVLVFVMRVFMRADEMAEVAALRGLENPTSHRGAATYRVSFRDVAASAAIVAFGVTAVLW